MNLLALETSTETLSLALQVGQQRHSRNSPGGALSSKVMLDQVLQMMADENLAFANLDGVVFGQGPGSFTGLRTACAVAQGLAYPHGLPVLPVCSLMAAAQDARTRWQCDRVMIALDARMGEVYSASFEWLPSGWQVRKAPHTLKPAQLIGPPEGWVVAGNAFATYHDQWPRSAGSAKPIEHHEAYPTAQALLDCAPVLWAQGLGRPAQQAVPVYVRDRVALNTAERQAGMTL